MSALPPPGTYDYRPQPYGAPGPWGYGSGQPLPEHPMPGEPMGKLRPSKLWVVVGSVLLAVGVIVGIVIIAVGVVRALESVTNCDNCVIARPGSYEVAPTRTQRYFLYVQGVSTRSAAQAEFDRLDVSLTDANGAPVSIAPYDSSFTLSTNNVKLVAVAQFHVRANVIYHLKVVSNGGSPVELRVGTVALRDLVRPIVVGVVVGGSLVLIGALTLIITLVRRSRARKIRQRQIGPPPGLTPWGATGYRPPVPWGTPPVPPPGTYNPPR
ncbi:MAG: hypothetical protein JWL70_2353 [Acidimicrobiia bacterium]|nr:hypothetical protein [Acidimicrobiia bacterium]